MKIFRPRSLHRHQLNGSRVTPSPRMYELERACSQSGRPSRLHSNVAMLGLANGRCGHHCRPCGAPRWPLHSILRRDRLQGSGTLRHSGARKSDIRGHVSRMETADDAYTPFTLMQYAKTPDRICHCEAKIIAQAPIEKCFELWNDWRSLLNFLDLIGELHIESIPNDTATLMCYYRWADTPTLEIMMKMVKEEIVQNKHIKFKSIKGMPMKGIVEFEEVKGGTEVFLRFENCLPQQYVEFNIGHVTVINDVNDILKENMEQFKLIAEGKKEPQACQAFTEEQKKAILEMCRKGMEKPLPDFDKVIAEAEAQ